MTSTEHSVASGRPGTIAASGLSVQFERAGQPAVVALDDVTLSIEPGEFVAVIGSSGAGKTTLLRSMTGFVRPTHGRLVVDGIEIGTSRGRDLQALRRRVATIYQHFNLVGRSSAFSNVLHGRLGHIHPLRGLLGIYPSADQEYAWSLLSMLGLADRALQRVDRLSGGERQRVAIARALAQEPSIILADEPAASLDQALGELIVSTLHERHRQEGTTIVTNLHDLGLARDVAQRIIGLREGRVVFDGPPAALSEQHVEHIYARNRSPERRDETLPEPLTQLIPARSLK